MTSLAVNGDSDNFNSSQSVYPSRKRTRLEDPCDAAQQVYHQHYNEVNNFLQVFNWKAYYPIVSRLCEFLDISSIINLTRTCKQMVDLYQKMLSTLWDVDRTLKRFVDEPSAFRSQMAQCNALISGSVPLQFFERVLWPESDLNVFMEEEPLTDAFSDYLVKREGYSRIHKNAWGEYDHQDILEVRMIEKFTKHINIDYSKGSYFHQTQCKLKSNHDSDRRH